MRKIPLLGLPLSLFLVAVLIVAMLPMVAMADEIPEPTYCWGVVTLDGAPAQDGTEVEIYIEGSASPALTTTTYTDDDWGPGTYSGQVYALRSTYPQNLDLIYKVEGRLAEEDGPSPGSLYGETQIVWLTASSVDPPQVTTDGYGNLSDTSVTLMGTLDDMGDCTGEVKVWFEYDGFTTTKQTMPATGPFSAYVSGLDPETEYTFNAKAETVAPCEMATAMGTPQSFTTLEEPAWPQTKTLNDGWNVISTPVWLDEDSDRTDDILSGDYEGYRWGGTSWKSLSKSYTWEPLEAFYIKVTGTATARFVPSQEMMAPNDRKLSSNKWALVGPSPIDGTSSQTMDMVLEGLKGNFVNVIVPALDLNGSGGFATAENADQLSVPAFGGAWVFVGGEKARTIVGFYGFTPVAQ